VISFVRQAVARAPELFAVVVAAAVGLFFPEPGRSVARHDGLNIVLAVLVFCSALTVPQRVMARLRDLGFRIVAVTAATSGAVVVLAWAVSHLVPNGALRFGVLAVGLAPVEIATLGIAPLGGGDALASGVMLMVSTALTALFAGPLTVLLATGATVPVGRVVWTLVIIVVAPFAAGLVLRTRLPDRAIARAGSGAAVAVTILVWLVASAAHVSHAYLSVVLALTVLIVAGAVVGIGLGRLLDSSAAVSAVFAASMRDFAIAAGIAAAAFGTAAAAPLGVYGIMVMAWGTGLAALLRHQRPAAQPGRTGH